MSDAAARLAALDTWRHVQLQAPAGSGKTTVLVQRFLCALAVADEPEEVLAITFTRKAASEMRERVLLALQDSLPQTQVDRAAWQSLRTQVLAQAGRQGWDLAELPQRLRIQTIDSLAHELARAMPVLGRMQTALGVADDPVALYAEAARETLRFGDADADYCADTGRLLRRLDNNVDEARKLLAQLLPGRNRWQALLLEHAPGTLADAVAASLQRIVVAAMEQLHAALPPQWFLDAAGLARAAAANRRDAGDATAGSWQAWLSPQAALTVDPGQLTCWQAVVDLALRQDGQARATINVSMGFPPKQKALKDQWKAWMEEPAAVDALALLQEIRALPVPELDAEERQVLTALARVLLLAGMQLKLVFRAHGLVDHAEITAIARQALRTVNDGAGFSLRQTLRVSHLLVDESQDISPDQLELIDALTSGWQRGDHRSLFMVGDPMQSIYLFRDSEVGLFLRIREQGVGAMQLQDLRLTRNFRSQAALVQWSNQVFSLIFPRQENLRGSAVGFLASQAARAPDERLGAEVELWPQPADDSEAEAAAIAAEIVKLRARDPACTVAVLVRTRLVAGPVLRALQAAAIPTLGVDLAALAERHVVRDLVALGRALLDAADRSAWLAVLRSPPCGLLLDDLLRLTDAAGKGPLADMLESDTALAMLSPDGAQRLRRVGPLLAQAWRHRGSLDIAGGIEQCWQALGGPAACQDATELAAARQYLVALRRLQEQAGILEPGRLEALAARLRDRGGAVGESPVEVLTIHHAKGLEWDVVFVPGLGKYGRRGDAPLLRWLQLPSPRGGNDLLMAVRSIGAPNSSDPLAAYIRRLQNERQANERLRLLYVAVTRARLRLYLSGHAPPGTADAAPRPASGSLLELLWPALGAQYVAALAPLPASNAQITTARPLRMLWHRLPADYQPPALRDTPLPESLAHAGVESAASLEYSWVGPLARAAGTVLHAELERLARLGEGAVGNLPQRTAACEAWLRELGIAPDTAGASALQIVARLQELVREERARWLLFAPHRDAGSEVQLSGLVEGELRSVVIDRMFIDADGTRWIIDYKTGVHRGSGLAQFVAREQERYAPQLRLYARLAAGLGNEPVRTALYFPWPGVFSESPAAGVS